MCIFCLYFDDDEGPIVCSSTAELHPQPLVWILRAHFRFLSEVKYNLDLNCVICRILIIAAAYDPRCMKIPACRNLDIFPVNVSDLPRPPVWFLWEQFRLFWTLSKQKHPGRDLSCRLFHTVVFMSLSSVVFLAVCFFFLAEWSFYVLTVWYSVLISTPISSLGCYEKV